MGPCTGVRVTQCIGTRGGTGRAARSQLPWQEIIGQADMSPTPIPFHETSGPVQSILQESEPVVFDGKLVDDRVMGIIIDETNW